MRISDWSSDVCSSDLPTKTGSKPTATSIWTNCASRRKPNYAKPHDQHHDRQFAELDAHNPMMEGSNWLSGGAGGDFRPVERRGAVWGRLRDLRAWRCP